LALLDSPYGIGAKPGQAICLGFEWGGVRMGDHRRMMQERGGGHGGGWGGGMEGGRPGEGRGGMEGGRGDPGMRPPEKQEIWVKTSLASSPEK